MVGFILNIETATLAPEIDREYAKKYHEIAIAGKHVVDEILHLEDGKWSAPKHSKHKKQLPDAYMVHRPFSDDDNTSQYYKGVGTLPFPLATVYKALYDIEELMQWDSDLAECLYVDLVKSGDLALSYTKTKKICGGLISSRDFVTIMLLEEHRSGVVDDGEVEKVGEYSAASPNPKNAYTFYWADCEANDRYPETKSVVRGVNFPGGYRVEPISENETRLTVLFRMDMKGRLPHRLIDKAIGGAVLDCYWKLYKYLSKREKKREKGGEREREEEEEDEGDDEE